VRLGTANILDLAEIKKLLEVSDDTQGEIVNLAAQIAEDRLVGFSEAKKSIVEFRNFLVSIVAKVVKSENFKGETIYIFIDELDRRKPPYAVDLLETIKHLFSVPGLVFVLEHFRLTRAHSHSWRGSSGIRLG
jgi:hypothetical protein